MLALMRLRAYLAVREESARAFAVRAGLQERTVQRLVEGDGCNAATALAIIRASQEQPTPNGGTVELEDLVVADVSPRERGREVT